MRNDVLILMEFGEIGNRGERKMGEETTENYTTLYLFLFNDNLIKFHDVFGFRSSKKNYTKL